MIEMISDGCHDDIVSTL